MRILAIEQSTSNCSAVIMRDGGVVAEQEWENTNLRTQHFFALLPVLFQKAMITPSDIDTYATGLGPGSFSGLRCALSALNGLALPDKKRVFGITSADALAWQTMQETGAGVIMILGDARRDHIWHVCYDRRNNLPQRRAAVSLVAADKLSSILEGHETIATSDWDRIGERIRQSAGKGIKIIAERRIPRASTIGELVARKIAMNLPSEPLTPIYLHPPVAVR